MCAEGRTNCIFGCCCGLHSVESTHREHDSSQVKSERPMRASASRAAAAVKQALQQFLQLEAAYLVQLDGVESDFAKKLRFQASASSSPCSSSSVPTLQDQVGICRFVDALAQLRHLHHVFGTRLQASTTASLAEGSDSGFETRLVDALDDMLNVIRYQYGQLFCNMEATQALLEKARSSVNGGSNHSGGDVGSVSVLHQYLVKEGISVEELVMRPLHRFNAIVEFVEALSSLCADSAVAPRLRQLAENTRHYTDAVQSEFRDEQERIKLQAEFLPSAVCAKLDLSAEKLITHGESRIVALRDYADTISDSRAETLYAHCFQSGKLIYSKREASVAHGKLQESADSFSVQGSLELKQDPVFFECVPDAVLGNAGTINGAFALLSSRKSAFFGFEESSNAQHWSTTIKSLLSQNETRTQVLRSQRSFDDIEIPQEVAKQLKNKKKRDSLVPFPFFHDDDLPGIFWLESDAVAADGADGKWDLVELMFHDQWLSISKVLGWKHHTLLHHLDCENTTIDIRDEPSGKNDWSLVISIAQGGKTRELKLVSKRRSRIDFWFDQISKAVAPSAQYEDSELPPNEGERFVPVKAVATEDQPFTNARAKRNKNSSVSTESTDGSVEESAASAKKTTKKRKSGDHESETQKNSDVANPVAEKKPKKEKSGGAESMKRKNAGSKIDSLVQVAQDTLEGATTGNAPKRSQREPVMKKAEDISKLQSPAIKTPKRRWLKLKVVDSDDSILLDTDVSQDTTVDETTSNDARQSQLSQNPKNDIRIILTGIEPTPAIHKKIKAIGSVYEDDIEKATHVVAPKNQLKRTVKLLCGISRCDHILDEKWLDSSAKAGGPLNEQDFCLLDTKAQEKWHFDLHKTMYEFTPEQRRQLFVGHTVFITNHKSMLPPVKDLVKIVECAGGKAEVKGSAGPSDLVITSEAALSVSSVQKSLASANPQRIYSPELILSSVLQQHIDFNKNHLELPSASSGSSRKRR